MAKGAAQIWIEDDGELGSIRVLLEELGINYRDAPGQEEASARLMISTPRYAMERGRKSGARCSFEIVVTDAISNTMKAQLQRLQCDYIVEEPVHPSALQLLILYALYRGPERRRTDRVAVTESVRLKVGWRSREATLIGLSGRGCQLICDDKVSLKEKVVIQIDKTVTGKGALNLRGKVVSSDPEHDDGTIVSIAFGQLKPAESTLINRVMKKNAVGDRLMKPVNPAKRAELDKTHDKTEEGTDDAADSDGGDERRASPRAEFSGRVLASGGGEARALIGRDLSIGGMLVESDSGLEVGDDLKLVIYGRSGVDPVVVKASVVRDQGDKGMGIVFLDVSLDACARLENLVASLPVITAGSEQPPGIAGESIVVTELVEQCSAK